MFRLGADVSGFRDAFRDAVEVLETTENKAQRVGASLARAFDNIGAGDSSAKLAARAKSLQASFELIEKAHKEGKVTTADYEKAQASLVVQLQKLGGVVPPLVQNFDRLADALKAVKVDGSQFEIGNKVADLKKNLDYLDQAYKAGKLSAADFAAAQKSVGAELDKLSRGDYTAGVDKLAKKYGELGNKLQDVGRVLTVGLTAPLLAGSAAALKAAGDYQSLEIGLQAVTKEAGPLEKQLLRLREVAKLPGLGFKEAVQGSINLQAAGFSAGLAERGLKAFGNALATVGKGRAELDGVITALSQIASKGKVSAEEINQLAERLPQIRVAIKNAFGEGFNDAKAFEEAGISAETFIEKIIGEFEKLPKAVGGIKNEFENLTDELDQTLAEAGKALIPFGTAALKALQPLLGVVRDAAGEFARLPEPVQSTVFALGALAAGAGPALYALGGISNGLKELTPLLSKLATSGAPAGQALGAVSASAGLLAGSLVAVTAAIVGFSLYEATVGALDFADSMTALYEATHKGEKGATAFEAAINDSTPAVLNLTKTLGNMAEYANDHFWEAIVPTAGMRERWQLFALSIEQAVGVFPLLEGAAKKAQQGVNDSMRKMGEAAMQAQNGKGTAAAVKANIDSMYAEKAANIQALHVAEETLKALKKMKASKEELAEATRKVTEAERKLHPNLTATGDTAGRAAGKVDTLAAAMNKLGVKGDATDTKQWADALATIEKAYKQGKVSAEDWAKAQSAAFEKIHADLIAFDKLVERRQGTKNVAVMRQMFPNAWFDDAKKAFAETDKLIAQFGKVESASRGLQNVNFAKDLLRDVVSLEDALKSVRGNQESLTESARRSAAAYHAIQDAVDGIRPNPLGATQFQADIANIEAISRKIAALRQEAPINPFNTAALQEAQERIKQVKSDLASIRTPEDAYAELGLKSIKDLQIEVDRTAKAYEILATSGTASIGDITLAQRKLIEEQIELAKAAGEPWGHLEVQLERVNARLETIAQLKGFDNLTASVANFVQTFNSEFGKLTDGAGDALSEALFNPESLGPNLTKLWKTFKDSMKDALGDALQTAFIDPITRGLKDAVSGIVGGFLKNLGGGIAGNLGGILGGGNTGVIMNATSNATRGAQNVANAAMNVPGGVLSKGAGVAGQAAGMGVSAITGMVTGGISAVSDVISNFQFKAMNKSLDLIEKATRYTEAHTLHILEKLNEYIPALKDINTTFYTYIGAFGTHMATVEGMATDVKDLALGMASALENLTAAIRGIDAGDVSLNGEAIEVGLASDELAELINVTRSGLADVVSAIIAQSDRTVGVLGAIAETGAVGKIDELQKELQNIVASNGTIDASLTGLREQLKSAEGATRDALIQQIQLLESQQAMNNSRSTIIEGAITAIKDSGAKAAQSSIQVAEKVGELTTQLAQLQTDRDSFLNSLPPELRAAINDGKLAELTAGQDQFAIDAVAEYVRIKTAIDVTNSTLSALGVSIEKAVATKEETKASPTNANSGAMNVETMEFDPSGVRTNIVPTQGGYDTSALLAALSAFQDRVSQYWERLFEVLAQGLPMAGAVPVEKLEGTVEGANEELTNAVEDIGDDSERTAEGVYQTRSAVWEVTGAVESMASESRGAFRSFTRAIEDSSREITTAVLNSEQAGISLGGASAVRARSDVGAVREVVEKQLPGVMSEGWNSGEIEGWKNNPDDPNEPVKWRKKWLPGTPAHPGWTWEQTHPTAPMDFGPEWKPLEFSYPKQERPVLNLTVENVINGRNVGNSIFENHRYEGGWV